MPFNGSGTFTLVAGTPFVTGTTISSTVANNLNNDFANNGFSNCLTKDGQTTPTANLPLGGFKITGLGAGTLVADAPRVSQVQNSAFNTLASVSGVTTITGSAAVTPAAYAEGQTFSLLAVGANATAPTLNVSSIGAVPIFWNGSTATSSMWSTGSRLDLTYISTSSQTGFHVLGHSGFMPTNFLRLKGAIAAGAGDGSAIPIAPTADGQIPESTASASGGIVWKQKITLATPQASTSGTSIDFTGIPAGVKRITVMFNGVSTNGSSSWLVQLGDAGGPENTGYLGSGWGNDGTNSGITASTAGFLIRATGATNVVSGALTLTLENSANFTWIASGTLNESAAPLILVTAGRKSTSAELTQVRITTVNGTDAFDLGEINISYE